MKIYLLEQNIVTGYDTYDSCVVCAESEEEARKIHPSSFVTHYTEDGWKGTYSGGERTGEEYNMNDYSTWVCFERVDKIIVTCLGDANKDVEKGVVCASYNAG